MKIFAGCNDIPNHAICVLIWMVFFRIVTSRVCEYVLHESRVGLYVVLLVTTENFRAAAESVEGEKRQKTRTRYGVYLPEPTITLAIVLAAASSR